MQNDLHYLAQHVTSLLLAHARQFWVILGENVEIFSAYSSPAGIAFHKQIVCATLSAKCRKYTSKVPPQPPSTPEYDMASATQHIRMGSQHKKPMYLKFVFPVYVSEREGERE